MHSWRFYTDYHELLVYINQANDINKSLQGKHMFFWKVAQVATQLLYVSKSKHGSSIAKASNFFQRNWNPNSLCENPQILNVGQWGGHQCCSLRTSGSPTVQTHSKTTFLHTVRVHPDSFVWGGDHVLAPRGLPEPLTAIRDHSLYSTFVLTGTSVCVVSRSDCSEQRAVRDPRGTRRQTSSLF